MARILRGEIWWADLNPVRGKEQAGRRPVPRLPDTLTAPPAKMMTVRLLNSSSPRNKKEGGEFCLSTLF